MTEFETIKLAQDLMNQHGLIAKGWRLEIRRGKMQLGICIYPNGKHNGIIGVSANHIALNSDESVRDTILHEICHALLPKGYGHNWNWRMKCRELGCNPDRLASNVQSVKGAYIGVCPICGKVFYKYRSGRYLNSTFTHRVKDDGRFCGGKFKFMPTAEYEKQSSILQSNV